MLDWLEITVRKICTLLTYLFAMLFLFVGIGCAPAPPVVPKDFGKYTIAIDPGHGGQNEGVKSVWGDLEKYTNMEVANMLARQLLATGHFAVKLVRISDVDLTPAERAEIVEQSGADALVSIHFNGNEDDKRTGFALVWSRTNRYRDNMRLGAHISNALTDLHFWPDTQMGPSPEDAKPVTQAEREHTRRFVATARTRGIYEDCTQYIGLLRRGKVPSILVEGGYATNYIDATMFKIRYFRGRLVNGITVGLINFFADKERIKKNKSEDLLPAV
jgi:N-acetylmuramoyl-L-alanine amidase